MAARLTSLWEVEDPPCFCRGFVFYRASVARSYCQSLMCVLVSHSAIRYLDAVAPRLCCVRMLVHAGIILAPLCALYIAVVLCYRIELTTVI